MSYVWEKLYQAVDTLTTCKKPLRECLVDVCTYNLNTLDENHFPEENLKCEFRRFIDNIARYKTVENEGRIQATINNMNNYEVLEMVEKILNMYDEVASNESISY